MFKLISYSLISPHHVCSNIFNSLSFCVQQCINLLASYVCLNIFYIHFCMLKHIPCWLMLCLIISKLWYFPLWCRCQKQFGIDLVNMQRKHWLSFEYFQNSVRKYISEPIICYNKLHTYLPQSLLIIEACLEYLKEQHKMILNVLLH